MIFDNISFIKPGIPFEKEFTGKNYAPMFRKSFFANKVNSAKLYICGLGYAYCYINGKAITKDLFTAPVSDYNKTLWYNTYDVTDLISKGENAIGVWCGNGWYNEDLVTVWNYHEAPWRDLPKFILRLDINGECVLKSDDSWRCLPDSAVWFNALRSGEYFDARKFDKNWANADFDDSAWAAAAVDKTPPGGVFRKCTCEPIRECEIYKPVQILPGKDGKIVYDLGQNISGYVRLCASCESGRELVIRYSEQLKEDNSREINNMSKFYTGCEFQTDRFICSGEKFPWSPKFAYHGFRYIEIEGLKSPDEAEVYGVFVHQDVERRTTFECSDEFLTKMFRAGIYSVYSNMFYNLTDCPTREKLGWTNDAQSSAEQIMTNFEAESFLKKWLVDIHDAMLPDGRLPGIIPTSGWGFDHGPVCDGILFEIPYRIYLHTKDKKPLCDSLTYFDRYFAYVDSVKDEDGFFAIGLPDWSKPGFLTDKTFPQVPSKFICSVLIVHFCRIAALAADLSATDKTPYAQREKKLTDLIKKHFILPDGRCVYNEQTAAAMLIYYDIYDDITPLKKQLMTLLEQNEFRHNCGMVGLRRLYLALNKCGLYEYAYNVITSSGYPSCREWFEQGATTLWEYWEWELHDDSKNHHMYSDFMSWIVKTILGISQEKGTFGFEKVNIDPIYLKNLDWAKGTYKTVKGEISVDWKKQNGKCVLKVSIPDGMNAYRKGVRIPSGENVFTEEIDRM